MNEELNVMGQGMEPVRDIEIITQEILFYKHQGGVAILEIGTRLIEAKEQLKHGEWLDWLKDRVDFSEVTAQRFMRLAREYSNPSPVTDLGVSKALALLALPESEREDFMTEKHEVNGVEKSVAEMSKRELEKAIRERDEARRKVEELEDSIDEQQRTYDVDMETVRAEANAAEQARAKMAEDMTLLKERMDGLNGEVEEKTSLVQRLEAELQELRERPVDVAVQEADPAELERAKEEGAEEARAEMAGKIEQAKAEVQAKLDKAKAELEKATAKEKEGREKVEDLLKRLARAEEEAKAARKNAQVAGNEELATFKVLFAAAQDNVNKLAEVLHALDRDGRQEDAGKLRKALGALAAGVQKLAEETC